MPNPFGLVSEESFNSKMADISNGLIAINDTLKKAFTPSSWDVLQQKVRSNDMADINLGDEIISSYDGSAFTWTIVGKNADASLPGNSLTLLSKTLVNMNISYNGEWCVYECTNELPAGKYSLSIRYSSDSSGSSVSWTTFYFKTTQKIPAGGVIIASNPWYSSSTYATYLTIRTASSRRYNTNIESNISASTSSVSGSTALTASDAVIMRSAAYPQDYKYLQIRQWLNTDKSAGEWWEQIYSGDVEPNYYNSSGFMKRIDQDLVKVVGKKTFDNKISDYFYIADYTGYSYMDTQSLRAKTNAYYTRSKIYNADGSIVTADPSVHNGKTWNDARRFAIMCNVM